MTQTEPQFKVGDRFWTHYDFQWGTVKRVGNTDRNRTHGVTGGPLDDTTWYDVEYDNGATNMLDDAHGNWDMARMVPPHIAKQYGYGDDPKQARKIRIDLTPEQLQAVLHEVGQAVNRLDAETDPESEPLYQAERELDSALLQHEQR